MARKKNQPSPNPSRLLAIAEDEKFRRRLQKVLKRRKSVEVVRVTDISAALDRFRSATYDVVIFSSLSDIASKETLVHAVDRITTESPGTQILLLIDPDEVATAFSTLKAGAYQYAKEPVSDQELRLLIETALEKQPGGTTNKLLRLNERIDRFEKLVGRSRQMQKVYQQIRQAAKTDVPILLLGETGTGKDLAAQAIHRRSARRTEAYIPVNLGALPSELVASELFGHEKGAFTGAHMQHKGKFEQGSSGTVFLDEIDTVDEKVQISLLRLIEQKKFYRLGGRRAITSEARIIAASNNDLHALVDQETFRQDLFYRLDVFRISLPALRERSDDIPLLVQDFIQYFNATFNKNIRGISPQCLSYLQSHDWPGNVRELKNVIQRAMLVCQEDIILPSHLPPRFQKLGISRPTVTFKIGTTLEEVEREMIVQALAAANNNRKRAAELLGISRRAIYNKLHKHNLS